MKTTNTNKPDIDQINKQAYLDLLRREAFRIFDAYQVPQRLQTEHLFNHVINDYSIDDVLVDYCDVVNGRCEPINVVEFNAKLTQVLMPAIEYLDYRELLRRYTVSILREHELPLDDKIFYDLLEPTDMLNRFANDVSFRNGQCFSKDAALFDKFHHFLEPILEQAAYIEFLRKTIFADLSTVPEDDRIFQLILDKTRMLKDDQLRNTCRIRPGKCEVQRLSEFNNKIYEYLSPVRDALCPVPQAPPPPIERSWLATFIDDLRSEFLPHSYIDLSFERKPKPKAKTITAAAAIAILETMSPMVKYTNHHDLDYDY